MWCCEMHPNCGLSGLQFEQIAEVQELQHFLSVRIYNTSVISRARSPGLRHVIISLSSCSLMEIRFTGSRCPGTSITSQWWPQLPSSWFWCDWGPCWQVLGKTVKFCLSPNPLQEMASKSHLSQLSGCARGLTLGSCCLALSVINK